MAITTQDVKLFKSERMDDTPEGGDVLTVQSAMIPLNQIGHAE